MLRLTTLLFGKMVGKNKGTGH